jgi:large subunit ribosomal protein L4
VATVDIRTQDGAAAGTRDLAPEYFEAEINVGLMHQVVVAAMAGLRAGTHSTKTRGKVRGGGKKPWRQKGTGRARQGSIRSPQWVGGGISHGPQSRDHAMRVNKKMRRGALRSALTDTVRSGKLAAVDGLSFTEPKTSAAVAALDALELSGKILVILDAPSADGNAERSFRNLPDVRVAYAGGLGVYELLWADRVLFTTAALDAIEGKSAGASSSEEAAA